LKIINSVAEMQAAALEIKRQGKTIAFVPTMGYLHQGHASLLRAGRKAADVLVLSIFVNPIQFGQNEDLDRYPRNMAGDCALAEQCGVDVVFAPEASGMYQPGFQTSITVKDISLPLCGASRPGHFDGVCTVVNKLFNIVQPDVAFFGCKDFQQLAVIRRMVTDLSMTVEIVGMPIVREPDGLAMSSRNVYLNAAERKSALALVNAIKAARALYASGERAVDALKQAALAVLEKEPVEIDYLDFRDSRSLELVPTADDNTLLAMAVRVGKTRLIDNTVLGDQM